MNDDQGSPFMAFLLPFHATSDEYTSEQTRVYHDQSECLEAQRIQPMHRIDGAGGRRRCKVCEQIDENPPSGKRRGV